MECLLFTILAARNYDEDSGWMQFLVFIIIAVIFAINTLIKKSRENKTQFEDDRDLEGMLEQPTHKQHQEVKPAVKKSVSSKQKPVSREASVELRQSRSSRMHGSNVKTLEMPQVTQLSSSEEHAVATEEKAERPKAVETLVDLNNPDGLRKAVVLYEVIGKPISLRDE